MPELKCQCFQGWIPVEFLLSVPSLWGSEKLVGKEGKKLGVFPLSVYTYLEISRKTILNFSDCIQEFIWEKLKQISQDMYPTKFFTLIEGWMSYLHQALCQKHDNIAAETGRAFHVYQLPSRLREDASRKAAVFTIQLCSRWFHGLATAE